MKYESENEFEAEITNVPPITFMLVTRLPMRIKIQFKQKFTFLPHGHGTKTNIIGVRIIKLIFYSEIIK
jgi:hypothetical protein